MSETPRTDAFFYERNHEPSSKFMLKLARTLERELAAVTKERDALRSQLRKYTCPAKVQQVDNDLLHDMSRENEPW